jgi:hypothetical protein
MGQHQTLEYNKLHWRLILPSLSAKQQECGAHYQAISSEAVKINQPLDLCHHGTEK